MEQQKGSLGRLNIPLRHVKAMSKETYHTMSLAVRIALSFTVENTGKQQ